VRHNEFFANEINASRAGHQGYNTFEHSNRDYEPYLEQGWNRNAQLGITSVKTRRRDQTFLDWELRFIMLKTMQSKAG